MCARLYVRFISPRPLRHICADAGIFGPAHDAMRDEATPHWLRSAIADEIGWFEQRLAVPTRFGIVTRRSRRPYAGVCWFQPEAQECIARAYALKALVDEAGVPISVATTRAPGDIVWRDMAQVVAIPDRDYPVRRRM